jgi:hypothetical protein
MKQFCLKSNQTEIFLIVLGGINHSFLGHIMKRGGLENIMTTIKIEGMREQCEKIVYSLIDWHRMRSIEDTFRCMVNRGLESDDCLCC